MQVPAFARGAFRGFQPDLISIIRALQPVGTIARGCLRRLLAAGMTAAPELAPSAANGHGDAALAAMALAKRRVAVCSFDTVAAQIACPVLNQEPPACF